VGAVDRPTMHFEHAVVSLERARDHARVRPRRLIRAAALASAAAGGVGGWRILRRRRILRDELRRRAHDEYRRADRCESPGNEFLTWHEQSSGVRNEGADYTHRMLAGSTLLVATTNPGKVRKIRRALADLPLRLTTLESFDIVAP